MISQTHSLIPLLSDIRLLRKSARQCMKRCSSPGIDRITWGLYRNTFQRNLELLSEQIRTGAWHPGSLKPIHATLFTGKKLFLVVPTVEDRIVHRSMRNVIEPIFEKNVFLDFVSGFRPRRSRITSLRQAWTYIDAGYRCVADIDVAKVSDGSSVDEVVDWLADEISDGSFLRLVREALQGLPTPICPGAGLSPFLINVRLSRVDRMLRSMNVVRFADNYCVFCKTPMEAEEAFKFMCMCLNRHNLDQAINKSKVRLDANPEDLFLITG